MVPIMARLPPEISAMVAGYLVRECAITHIKAVWKTRCESKENIVDLTRDMRVQYICIDGVRYVARLTNRKDCKNSKRLLHNKSRVL